MPNSTFDRTTGSHSVAAAGQRVKLVIGACEVFPEMGKSFDNTDERLVGRELGARVLPKKCSARRADTTQSASKTRGFDIGNCGPPQTAIWW